jgi:outer membrane immunogenic protein
MHFSAKNLSNVNFGKFLARALVGGIALFSAGQALAADLPTTKEPPAFLAPVSAYNWTGFYVGVNAGGGYDHFAFPYNTAGSAYYTTGTSGIDSGGAVAGGQIGFNYEMTNLPFIGHAVVGIEADSDWSGIRGYKTVEAGPYSATFGTRFEYFGTLRSRIGYNFDRLLLYFTSGISYAVVNTSVNVDGLTSSHTATRSGLPFHAGVVGIGAEYAVTNNVTVKAEYLYDFVGAHYSTYTLSPDTVMGYGTRSMYHIGRIGVNYKFDWFAPAAPVVSKY